MHQSKKSAGNSRVVKPMKVSVAGKELITLFNVLSGLHGYTVDHALVLVKVVVFLEGDDIAAVLLGFSGGFVDETRVAGVEEVGVDSESGDWVPWAPRRRAELEGDFHLNSVCGIVRGQF